MKPVFDYMFEHFDEGGDRHTMAELLRGARICVPSHAATLPTRAAHALIDKLRHYPALDDDDTIKSLKDDTIKILLING